jgi:HSP20 family protein
MIPGVRKDDMDIAISRDAVTLRGQRAEEKTVGDDDYIVRELYWGSFSRTIHLPHEIDIDNAEAVEVQGVLTIKLPRTDKERKTKLRIKSL